MLVVPLLPLFSHGQALPLGRDLIVCTYETQIPFSDFLPSITYILNENKWGDIF